MIPAEHSEVKLAKYELLGEIGHGGMATVYRARDRRLGREVAIKVIHRHLRENPEVARRFASEAKAVAKLKHPNIVEVYDVSSDEEVERYLVVELIEGMTLRQCLQLQSPLPPEIGACIAIEICGALSQAHRNGVIHRDVKPENVLLKMDGEDTGSDAAPRVKLTDFGIAKLLDAQGVTHTGQVLGSPAHMAPEQIEGGDVDARADVFGVGVLLYEMMTGSMPFEGQNPAQVLRRVLEGAFLPAERARPQVGTRYGHIIARALAHDAADRYPSARELSDALTAELGLLGLDDPRREISAYLADGPAYIAQHQAHFVERIAQCGALARDQGEVMMAAACFNRALAYRPDDTMLLAEVAGLARLGRMKRRLLRACATLTLLSVCASGLAWAAQALTHKPLTVTKFAKRARPSSPRVSSTPPPSTVAALTAPAIEKSPLARPPRPQLAKPVQAVPVGSRPVRTPVVGPQNARVRIDGELLPWFQTHYLTLGPHIFEFVPPSGECCETSPATTVEVTAGDEPQMIRGVIRFKPAVLRLAAPEGSHASCGIGPVITAGGSRDIPMDRPDRQLTCTLVPAPGTSARPRQVEVDLRPGRTFTITGP